MKINSFQKLYVHALKDVFNAEKQIVKAFPKMIKATENQVLKSCLEDHLAESKEHVRRLEGIFEMLNMSGGRQKCKSMEGMISELDEFMDSVDSGSDVMDVGLIAAVQLIEHYEIATYGSVIQFAKLIGDNEVAKILTKTLKEEMNVDQQLEGIMKSMVSKQAASRKKRGGDSQQPSM